MLFALQYFPRNFTNANIRPYKDFPSKLRVFCGGRDPIIVSLIMSKGKGKGAQITTQWSQVVAASRMHKGDVFMFRFRRSPTDGLKLEVKKVM